MDPTQLGWLPHLIWNIADDLLRDVYVRGKYRDVILPMTVLRRLDAVLEPTKQAVLAMKTALEAAQITNQDAALRDASGQAFYNTSPFRLRDLKARATQQKLRDDFEAYLDSFSPNVQDILTHFEFRHQLPRRLARRGRHEDRLRDQLHAPFLPAVPAPPPRANQRRHPRAGARDGEITHRSQERNTVMKKSSEKPRQ